LILHGDIVLHQGQGVLKKTKICGLISAEPTGPSPPGVGVFCG
jgi:hypothetical protein